VSDALLLAHVGHWIWQLLMLGPILIGAAVLAVAEIRARRDPERYSAEAEEERAQGELDEILKG